MTTAANNAAGTDASKGDEGAAGGEKSDAGGIIGSADAGADKVVAKEGEKGDAGKADGKKGDETKVADLELKFPEGFKADEKLVSTFKSVAKELGLDSAKAQKLVDFNIAFEKERSAALQTQLDQQEKAWAKEIAEDKDFGGKNLDGSKIALGKFFKQYDPTGAAKKLIGDSGLGSHPTLVRFFFGLARAAAEDKVGGGAPAPAKQPAKSINDPKFLKGLFNKTPQHFTND